VQGLKAATILLNLTFLFLPNGNRYKKSRYAGFNYLTFMCSIFSAAIGYEQLFTPCSFYPILKLSQMIFAHHDKVFLCRSCYIQQVTDYRNQHHKKPHWDHNLLICFIKSKDRSNKF
jgi:hypothetical protein